MGPGGHRPPKCWPGPPNILVPTAEIRIVTGYFCKVAKSTLVGLSIRAEAMMILLTKIPMKVQIKP